MQDSTDKWLKQEKANSAKRKLWKNHTGITEIKLKMKLSAWLGKERICEIEERPFEISQSKQRMI